MLCLSGVSFSSILSMKTTEGFSHWRPSLLTALPSTCPLPEQQGQRIELLIETQREAALLSPWKTEERNQPRGSVKAFAAQAVELEWETQNNLE